MSLEWYAGAVRNLGVLPLIRLQLSRKMAKKGSRFKAYSKYLSHPVWVRAGTSDPLVLDQIFIEREYACLDSLKGVRRIIDCGANVGYSSAYFLSRYTDAFVIAVEPDKGNYEMLLQNLAPYAGRFIAINGAVWSHSTTLHFEAETMGEGEEWGRRVSEQGSGGTDVEAFDIATLMARKNWSDIDLLKMDIEGAEEELFAQNYEPWLSRTHNFVMEIHGEAREATVLAAIEGRNYSLSTSGELTVGLAV